MSTIHGWLAALLLALTGLAGPTVAPLPAPLPDGVTVTSSTTAGGPFLMTATNGSGSPVTLNLPAPKAADVIEIDTGSWDGATWSVELGPGTTATMSG
jgi:hypothetical protein